MKRIQMLLWAITILAVAPCEATEGITPKKPEPAQVWRLVAPEKSVAIDVSKMKLTGRLSDGDRRQVFSLLGRIEGISPKLLKVDTCWDECPVAIRVCTANMSVYCVKDHRTEWQIAHVVVGDPTSMGE